MNELSPNNLIKEESVISQNNPPGPSPSEPPPTKMQMLTNFANAITKWTTEGFPVASQQAYSSRLSICNDCEFWDAAGYAGTGMCLKCGCSRLKLHAGTSDCPIGKWSSTVITKYILKD